MRRPLRESYISQHTSHYRHGMRSVSSRKPELSYEERSSEMPARQMKREKVSHLGRHHGGGEDFEEENDKDKDRNEEQGED